MVFLTIEQSHSWIKSWLILVWSLWVINIEVDPSCLLEQRGGRSILHEARGKLTIKYSTHQLTKEEDYYQREDDKPETVKRRLDVENIAQRVSQLCTLP